MREFLDTIMNAKQICKDLMGKAQHNIVDDITYSRCTKLGRKGQYTQFFEDIGFSHEVTTTVGMGTQ
jgi:hypothetical protein